TRSGDRSIAHEMPRSTARAPGEGMPRWKSDRWTIRRPSRTGGRRGTTTSRRRKRTQPASKRPQPTPAAAVLTANRTSCDAGDREACERDDRHLIPDLALVPMALHRHRTGPTAVDAVVLAVPAPELRPVDPAPLP